MKMFKFTKTLPFIVTTIIFSCIVFMQMQRKTVLILHSYSADYSWVRDVNEGILRVLKDRSFVSIRWHYMNTKNHPDLAYKQKAGATARKVIDFVKPSVLLAVDDDAQEFAAKFYVNNADTYIVYAGVNTTADRYGYDKANNAIGIVERWPIQGIRDLIISLSKQLNIVGTPRVSHVSDKSMVVQFDDANIRNSTDWSPVVLGSSFLVETFDEWKRVILEAHEHMDFMLISNYRKIARSADDKTLVPYKEAMQWAFENSPVPIIGVNGFVCEDGAAMSIAASPFEQGQVAMQMALDLALGRKDIQKLKRTESKEYIIVMDESRVRKTKLQFPGIYKAFSKAINKFNADSE